MLAVRERPVIGTTGIVRGVGSLDTWDTVSKVGVYPDSAERAPFSWSHVMTFS